MRLQKHTDNFYSLKIQLQYSEQYKSQMGFAFHVDQSNSSIKGQSF